MNTHKFTNTFTDTDRQTETQFPCDQLHTGCRNFSFDAIAFRCGLILRNILIILVHSLQKKPHLNRREIDYAGNSSDIGHLTHLYSLLMYTLTFRTIRSGLNLECKLCSFALIFYFCLRNYTAHFCEVPRCSTEITFCALQSLLAPEVRHEDLESKMG